MERHVEFARLHNFRDLGGYPGADGRTVRWRRLYRADSLGKLRAGTADWDRYLALDIRTVIDLRHPDEVERHGRVPEQAGSAYHNLSIEHRSWQLAGLSPDIDIARFLADRYAEVVQDGAAEIRAVLRILAAGPAEVLVPAEAAVGSAEVLVPAEAVAGPAEGATVFHCAAGKDRTGLIAAILLDLLGVSEVDIVADFVRTERAHERFLADWLADHQGAQPFWPGFGRSPARAIELFLVEQRERYGSVRRYATDQLGVDTELIGALRHHYLTGDSA